MSHKFLGKKIFIFSLLFFALSFNSASAAQLTLSPSSGSYKVGDTIRVRVVLSASGQSANAVSGALTFSKDLLTLSSISKDNSLISLWPVEPSYSNSSGTANMEGVMLSGYSGSSGTIATLVFRAKAVGTATVKYTSASSVLANDGAGTNILSGTGQATFSISEANATTASAQPKEKEEEEEEKPVEVVKVSIPVFTDYSKEVDEGNYLVIKGSADPSVDVIISSDAVISETDRVVHESITLEANKDGDFIYVSNKRVEGGIYMISAQARNQDGVMSDKSVPVKITVNASSASTESFNNILNTFSMVIPIIGLIVLLVLLMVWGWYHILHYREHMQKKLADARNIVSKSFDILDEDVAEEVKIIKKVKGLHPLTENEKAFINQFKKDIEQAEKTILNKIK